MSYVEKLNQKGFNPYANMIGIEFLNAAGGECTTRITVRDDHYHPGRVVQGGVAFGQADSTMAVALMSTLEKGQNCSTIECKISYLSAVKEGDMICEARVIKRGRTIAFLESEVRVGDKIVARATASFAIFERREG